MNKTLKLLTFPFIISALLSSCVASYNMANAGIDPIAFTKPVYRDTATITDYIGGKFTHSWDSIYFNPNETNAFGQIYWFRTYSDRIYTCSYGAYSYLGNYNVRAVNELKGKKSYFGGGISGDLCLNIDLPMLDLRLLGLKGSLFYEDGNYSDFRKQLLQNSLGIASTSKFGTNISTYFGLDVKLKKSSLGFYCSSGISSGFKSDFVMISYGTLLNYQTNNLTFFIQNSSTISNLFYIGNEFSVGLNYRIK